MATILETPGVDFSMLQPEVARKLSFSEFCQATTWDVARLTFEAEGRQTLAVARRLPPKLLGQRLSSEGLPGWSVAMILEHLIEVGTVDAEIIVHLSHGERPWREMALPELPDDAPLERIVEDYGRFLDDFAGVLAEDVGSPQSTATYCHPLYGSLTAHGWLCLAAFHQWKHRVQLECLV